MDGQRFDALTRAFVKRASRREVAKGFLGSVLAAFATQFQRPVTFAGALVPSKQSEWSRGGRTPEDVADGVIAALLAHDFAALEELYFPGWEPAAWGDVWPERITVEPDFTGCDGIDYRMDSWAWETARPCHRTEFSTDVAVMMTFVPACGWVTINDRSSAIATLTMDILKGIDGWYLAGIVGFNWPEAGDGMSCIDQSTGLLPDRYVGTWFGRGWQNNPDTSWPIAISLRTNAIGSVVGTSTYPSLECEGQLVLSSIYSEYTVNVTLEETITVGRDNCVDGTFRLTPTEIGYIPFTWTNADRSTVAYGSLGQSTVETDTKTSLEIHASLCPAGYDGSDVFETCHDVGQADVWFHVIDGLGESQGGLTQLDTSSGPGVIVFENIWSGPNFISRQSRHVEGRAYIHCSTDDGETILAQVSGPAGEPLSLEIPEHKHVVCDWYSIPDACSSFGRPCSEDSDCCPGEDCSARGTCGTCDTDADCVGDFSCCPALNPVCEPLCGQPDSR